MIHPCFRSQIGSTYCSKYSQPIPATKRCHPIHYSLFRIPLSNNRLPTQPSQHLAKPDRKRSNVTSALAVQCNNSLLAWPCRLTAHRSWYYLLHFFLLFPLSKLAVFDSAVEAVVVCRRRRCMS